MESQVKRLVPLLALLLASISISLSVHRQNSIRPQNILAIAATNLTTAKPELSAHAYFVKIIGEQSPLIKQREWKSLPPASLSKLLTAVLAEEYLAAGDTIIFSENAKSIHEDGEKLSALEAGENLTKDEALKLLLISSANDAAVAIAEKLNGSVQHRVSDNAFAEIANKKAEQIGLADSQFLNPTGLDQEGHKSSPEDLARLAEYIWSRHPYLWEITRAAETNIYSESGREYKIKSTNKLLAEFPAILGGKTGFTDKAKESLILLYPVRPDKVAVIVILGSDDRFGDARKIIKWLESMAL